jgi:hypothetical protein
MKIGEMALERRGSRAKSNKVSEDTYCIVRVTTNDATVLSYARV